MKVRDHTEKKTDYKGRPTEARDELCPCRACFNAHDCGFQMHAGWQVRMECATWHNNGCPQPIPEPEHIYKSDRANICQRCGYSRRGDRKKAN